LPALVLLRKPLSGLAKRRKQPERYVQFALKILINILKDIDKIL
jgi:ABC-type phosphate/phosphonate transport system permease subunit